MIIGLGIGLDFLNGGVVAPKNTLIANRGVFVLAGDAMQPAVDYRVGAAAGALTVTGVAATLSTTASSGPSYALVGSVADTGAGGSTISLSGDIGVAAANRVVVIAIARQNAGAFTSVTVNGVSCTNVGAVGGSDIWYVGGSSPGSGTQSIVATGGAFELRGMTVWVLNGVASTTPAHTAGGSPNASLASVLVGDLVFGSNDGGGATFGGSTVGENHTFTPGLSGGRGSMADWLITAGASPFVVSTTGFDSVAASWR